MTVDTIEVANSLTIGGAPPLGQDAIDKLQDQIIAPQQTIYVDCQNGDDNNDGSTYTKRVKTLDRAIDLIKKDVPTITFTLEIYNDDTKNIYPLSKVINVSNKDVTISGSWQTWFNYKKYPKITVPYNKINLQDRDEEGNLVYKYGNVLVQGASSLYLQRVSIDLSTPKFDNPAVGLNCIAIGNTLISTQYADITLAKSASILNTYNTVLSSYKLQLTNVYGSGFLATCNRPASFPDNWNGIDGIDEAKEIIPSSIFCVINAALYDATRIDSNIKANGNNGYATSVHVSFGSY